MVNPVGNFEKKVKSGGKGLARKSAPGQPPMMFSGIKVKYILIVLFLIALGIWGSLTLSQSKEKKVKKQFHLLSEALSREPGENIFTLDQKLKKIGSLFDETCDIHIPAQSLSGPLIRDEITGYAARACLHFAQLNIKFHDFVISFPAESEARVRLTGRLTGKTTYGEAVDEAHELECLLKKSEKKWVFSYIEVVEVLKK